MVRTHALHRKCLFCSLFFLAQPFAVPCCTLRVPWKAQLRAFLPPRVLMKVSHTLDRAATLRVDVGGIFEPFVDETDLARIAISCRFALDLLCGKEGDHASA